MEQERLDRVQELFDMARAIGENEREPFLRSQCGGDRQLLDEVTSLLASHEPGFLEDPEHLRGFETDRPTTEAPEQIGPYRILRPLGHGGMGAVFLAEQEQPVRRQVALKLIRRGMDTEHVVGRFDSERQALALMNHANVAQVFDAGSTDDGRPYFVMEFVDGVPITEHCDRHRLPTPERLGLFIAVCQGIQHAHQKGIIHRDIKASNVMVTVVDGAAVPKIIDFGIAKATEQRLTEATIATEVGQIVGTPEYMSPEQAELSGRDIDTRTDVYSLGVLLYELIVGVHPFDSAELRRSGFDEMRRRIREEEPPRPSTRFNSLGETTDELAARRRTDASGLTRQLEGDLDWIAMKALEKDRNRRYASVSELTGDVARYLAHEPVTARPPSAAYRLGKFVRRHRVGVSFASLLLAALLLGLGGTWFGMLRANREARTYEALADYVVSVFDAANPDRRAGTVTVEQLAEQGVRRIDALEGEPEMQGRFSLVMGRIYRALGRRDLALPLLERSLPLLRASHGDESEEVVASLNEIANLAQLFNDHEKARSYYEEALPLAEKVWGPDDVDVGEVVKNLGDVYIKLEQLERARQLHRRALDIRLAALGPDDYKVAASMTSVARILALELSFEEAIAMHRRSIEIRERTLSPENANLGHGYYFLADTYRRAGRHEEAVDEYVRALRAWERSLPSSHPFLAEVSRELARSQAELGRHEEAGRNFARALQIAETALGSDASGLREYLESYGAFLRSQGDAAQARALSERAGRLSKSPESTAR